MCGITSQTNRRKLLGEADLTLKKAVDIAVGMELTDKEITQISAVQQVHKVQLQECFRCGKHNHSPDKCFHKLSECHICKRKGHISPKCPQKIASKPSASSKPKQAEPKQNKSFKKKKKSSRKKKLLTPKEVVLEVRYLKMNQIQESNLWVLKPVVLKVRCPRMKILA